jgi:hypothetical protein
MKEKRTLWRRRAFLLAFLVLTLFCWCPLGYGKYGEVARVLGVPSWVAVAFVVGLVLFVLEWLYLFCSGLALDDDKLADTLSDLGGMDSGGSAKEDA